MKRRILSLLIVLTLIIPCGVFAAGEGTTKFSPSSLSLYVGEACNLSVTTSEESLDWSSDNTEVATLFGTYYKAKTVCAKGVGTANITVSKDGTTLATATVTVSEKPSVATTTATFTQGTQMEINKNVFGQHISTDVEYNDAHKLVEDNIKFGSVRVAFKPGDDVTDYAAYASEYLGKVKRDNMTVVVIFSRFKTDTTEQLLEQVKAIYETLKDYQSEVYIELSNEMYSQLSDTYTVTDYTDKVKDLSTKIATYKADGNKKILTAVPIYGLRKQGMPTWDDAIEGIKDYYDGIVVHPYTSISRYDGYTQNTTMHRMFSSNENMFDSVAYAVEKYSGKQIWLTEYGILDSAMLAAPANTGEKGRLQNSKTVGAALCNIDKSLNFLSNEKVNFANYHTPVDSQLFGIVQGTTILPNYYAFEKVSDILQECTKISRLTSTDVPKFDFVGNNVTLLTQVEAVSGYGFYDAQGLKYVVFVNRDENPCTVSVDSIPVTHVWEYADTTPLGSDYLTKTITYLDAPANVPPPTNLTDSEKATSVTIKGYSMNVLAVSRGLSEGVTVTSSVNNKTFVPLDAKVDLTFSDEVYISTADVAVKVNNVKVPFTLSGSGKDYILSFDKEPETQYTIYVDDKQYVTFSTAYKTDTVSFKTKDVTVDLGSKIKNFTCEIGLGDTYLKQGSTATLTLYDNPTSSNGEISLNLGFSNTNGVYNIQWYLKSPTTGNGQMGPSDLAKNISYSKLSLSMSDYVLTLYGKLDDGTYNYVASVDLKGYRDNHIGSIDFGCVKAKIGNTSHMSVNFGAGIADGEIHISSADTDGNVCVNTSHISNNGVIICTAYDTTTSALVAAQSKPLTSTDKTVEFALGALETNNVKYMVFVWDSLENIVPLTQSCIYAIN